MTLRTKTITFAFPEDTAAYAAGAPITFARTLYVPEVNSRTFKAAVISCYARDNDPAATVRAVTSWTVDTTLGSDPVDSVDYDPSIDTLATSGNAWGAPLQHDLVDYFNASFGSGAAQTCSIDIAFDAPVRNVSLKIDLTFEYDDAAATTRIKTVRIPIEPTGAKLTTSLVVYGPDQIPALDTYLPEASKNFRNVFFEVQTNECGDSTAATTDFQLGLKLDSASEELDGAHEAAQNANVFYRRLWSPTFDTSVPHDLRIRSTLAGRFTPPAVVLVATYEYNHSTSATIMNSLILPVPEALGRIGQSGSPGAVDKVRTKFHIAEPGPITLKQSAIVCSVGAGDDMDNFLVAVGAQDISDAVGHQGSTGGHRQPRSTYPFLQRIDAGGAAGAAFTPSRGENSLVVSYQGFGAISREGAQFSVTAMLILNYTSSKHSAGDAVHAHSVMHNIMTVQDKTATAYDLEVTTADAFAPPIPESNYWIVGYLVESFAQISQEEYDAVTFDSSGGDALSVHVEIANGEPISDPLDVGWMTKQIGRRVGGTVALMQDFIDFSPFFMQSPADIFRRPLRLGPQGDRHWRAASAGRDLVPQLNAWVTYHAITFNQTAELHGYSGDGSGVLVRWYRSDTRELVAEETTVPGGVTTLVWYDDTIALFAEAIQNSSHMGRSDNIVPT